MNIEVVEKYLNAFKNHEPVGDGKTVVTGIKFIAPNLTYASGRLGVFKYKVDLTLDRLSKVLICFDRDESNEKESKIVVIDTNSITGIELRGEAPKDNYDVKVEIV